MRRHALLAVALLAGPVLVGSATAADAETTSTTTVRGVVKNTAGKALPNITVNARPEGANGKIAVRTDSEGRYVLRVSDPAEFAEYNVCAAGDQAENVYPELNPTPQDLSYNSTCSSVFDLADAPRRTIDLTVYRRSVLSGTVRDQQGKPVVGATVVGCPWYYGQKSDLPDRGDTTRTDINGRYSLSMPAGGAALSVEATGFKPFLYKGVECSDIMVDPPLFLKLQKNLSGIDVFLTKTPRPAA